AVVPHGAHRDNVAVNGHGLAKAAQVTIVGICELPDQPPVVRPAFVALKNVGPTLPEAVYARRQGVANNQRLTLQGQRKAEVAGCLRHPGFYLVNLRPARRRLGIALEDVDGALTAGVPGSD